MDDEGISAGSYSILAPLAADERFIAAAPTLVADLLAEVKWQSEALARVAAVRDEMRSHDYMPIRAWGIEINNAMGGHGCSSS